MTIRARLLWLTLGLLIPLVAIGFFNLWGFWQVARRQLDESLEQQAELAASAFEQRLMAHRQTLNTISALANRDENSFTLKDYLDSVFKTRPEWLDVQIVNRDGATVLSQTNKNAGLQTASVKFLKDEAERQNSFIISTEQSIDQKLRLFSLAQPIGNGNFVVARIDGANASEVFENLELPEDNIIVVFDKDNRLLYRSRVSPEQVSLDVGETPFFKALSEKSEGTIEIVSPYDKISRVYGLARIETADSTVAVAIPSTKLYKPARQQFLRQLFFSLPIAILAIFAAFLISRSIAVPLRSLAVTTRRFGAGDLTARAEIMQDGSIGELASTFNQMAEEIAQREEDLKTLDRMKSEFVSNVSHELRTPLTTIKTFTRVLQSDKISDSERKEYLETIAAECDRQIDFVQSLLDLSRIESGAYKISLAPTDVVKLLWECVESQQPTATTRKLSLKFKAPNESNLLTALTDAGAFRQIVSSLIENAIKYTPEGGEISIAASEKSERIVIEIIDNGCGIAKEDLPHIFEKFYRGRPLQTRNSLDENDEFPDEIECVGVNESAGVGLGLYLVHGLVEQVGGEITAESPVDHETRGTKFTLLVPIAK